MAFPLWACLWRPDAGLVTVATWISWPRSDSRQTATELLIWPRTGRAGRTTRRSFIEVAAAVFSLTATHSQEKEQEVIKAEPEVSLDWICTLEENQDAGTLQKACSLWCDPGDLCWPVVSW